MKQSELDEVLGKHPKALYVDIAVSPPPVQTATSKLESEGGTKYDSGKYQPSLVSKNLIEQLSRVREFGTKKYTRDNWKRGFKYLRSIDAALRHIHAFLDGEDLDTESGLSHPAHAVACLEHLLWDMKEHPENDDRVQDGGDVEVFSTSHCEEGTCNHQDTEGRAVCDAGLKGER